MKNKFLFSCLAVLLLLSLSACGDGGASGNGSDRDTQSGQTAGNESSQNMHDNSLIDNGIVTNGSRDDGSYGGSLSNDVLFGDDFFGDDLFGDDLPAFSSLTEWYDSEYRTALEEFTNEILNSLGESFFITIQEPDTIVYNYRFTEQIDFSFISLEDVVREISGNLENSAAPVLESNIVAYRELGLPLNVIRMNYLNADGTSIYSQDISVGSDASPENSPSSGQYASLQEWLESEDAADILTRINEQFAGLGLTFNHSADGNIYVYEFHITDDSAYRTLSEEEITAFFDNLVDTAAHLSEDMSAMFSAAYGVRPGGFRYSFYGADGTLFYTRDVAP